VTATNDPEAASDGLAFVRPVTPTVVGRAVSGAFAATTASTDATSAILRERRTIDSLLESGVEEVIAVRPVNTTLTRDASGLW
jgi:hypothetical protein